MSGVRWRPTDGQPSIMSNKEARAGKTGQCIENDQQRCLQIGYWGLVGSLMTSLAHRKQIASQMDRWNHGGMCRLFNLLNVYCTHDVTFTVLETCIP